MSTPGRAGNGDRCRSACGCAGGPVTHCGRCAAPETERTTPPGQTALTVARSPHPAALDRMRRRLSAADLPALPALTARHTDVPLDPALALLDAWACAGHVLGFYTDRLVNEHYLRTCRQRRSAVELGRLVGYAPRPGVAADVHLAFTLDDVDEEAVLEVPAGTRAYSQPGPGETMQPFETSEALTGRPRWNVLRPRSTAPQQVAATSPTLDARGTATGLTKGSPLLVEVGGTHHLRTVAAVEPLSTEDRTRVVLVTEQEADVVLRRESVTVTTELLQDLLKEPAGPPADGGRPGPDPADIFTPDSYAAYGLLASAYPALRGVLSTALGGISHTDPTGAVTVYAMRVKAALHGHSASLVPVVDDNGRVTEYREWNPEGTVAVSSGAVVPEPVVPEPAVPEPADGDEGASGNADTSVGEPPSLHSVVTPLFGDEIALDAVYDTILPGSLVALVSPVVPEPSGATDQPDPPPADRTRVEVREVAGVRTTTRTAFHLPVRVTVLALVPPADAGPELVRDVRQTVVYAQSEALELAEVPVPEEVYGEELELDGYYPGLQPGRLLVVTGERTDILRPDPAAEQSEPEVTGVHGTEVVRVSTVEHRIPASAEDSARAEEATQTAQATQETLRTVLTVEPALLFRYRRESVRILGNVAPASHGESRAEVLGSGDAARPLQTFPLKQGPLTYVPGATPSGVSSTLEVHVEDLRWHEAPNAAAVLPGERRYVERTDDEGGTAVTFGLGARLPTGPDNVRALYRSGLGSAGNVRAEQVSVLASRPNGVTGVTNPSPATGGADPDGLEAIRQRAPLGLTALDRLVSAVDLEDFARAFAGIGKARLTSQEVPADQPTRYTLTVAAVGDAPLAGSTLLADLRRAIAHFGNLQDPGGDQPLSTHETPGATVAIAIRTALLLAMRVRIRLAPDHLWETVQPRLREALFAAFGFEAREIGQVPQPGEAMTVLQRVRGVAWVDLVAFGTIDPGPPDSPRPPADVAAEALALLTPAVTAGLPDPPPVAATQIAYLSGAPGTLLLEQIPEEARP
jgi:baseplate J-like protein